MKLIVHFKMVNDIQCERTKQFIQSFGTQTPLPWEQIVLVRDRDPNFEALEMISRFVFIFNDVFKFIFCFLDFVKWIHPLE